MTNHAVGEVPDGAPHFIIVGACKAGTTTLYDDLSVHPDAALPDDKEPDILHRARDARHALDLWHRHFASTGKAGVRGEGSTYYTMSPDLPPVARLARDAIGAEGRIVYIVRDPIRRIESHLAHDHAVGRLAARDYDKAALEMGRFVSWSDYGRQIAPWIEAFGRSNVLLVCFEDFVANRHRIGREVAAFVGLDPELMVPRTAIAIARGQKRVARTRWLSAFIEGDFYSNAVRRALPKTVRSKVRHLLSRNFTSEEVTLSDQTLDALQERLRHVPDEVRALGLDVKGWTT